MAKSLASSGLKFDTYTRKFPYYSVGLSDYQPSMAKISSIKRNESNMPVQRNWIFDYLPVP